MLIACWDCAAPLGQRVDRLAQTCSLGWNADGGRPPRPCTWSQHTDIEKRRPTRGAGRIGRARPAHRLHRGAADRRPAGVHRRVHRRAAPLPHRLTTGGRCTSPGGDPGEERALPGAFDLAFGVFFGSRPPERGSAAEAALEAATRRHQRRPRGGSAEGKETPPSGRSAVPCLGDGEPGPGRRGGPAAVRSERDRGGRRAGGLLHLYASSGS